MLDIDIPESISTDWVESLNEEELVSLLIQAKDAYYNDNPIMDDDTFDMIEMYLRNINPNSLYFMQVGSEVRGEKVPLPVSMGSLDQVYAGDAEKWIRSEKLLDETFVITDKEDGLSILLVYDDKGALKVAFTRGDGVNGHDITRHVRLMKNIPQTIDTTGEAWANLKTLGALKSGAVMFRGEIILKDEDFARLNSAGAFGREYKNPRNYTAGQINKKTASQAFLDNVHVIVYEVVI